MSLLSKLPEIRGRYRENATLHNWFGLEAKAEILFKPADLEDLSFFLKNCPKNIRKIILGAASNVIISEFINGVVIRLPSSFSKISYENGIIKSGASALCGAVAKFCVSEAVTNLEFFSGIPGSIGGAISMNAGCYGFEVSDFLVSAKAIDFDGNIIELKNDHFEFSYRKNNLAAKYIFIEGVFSVRNSTSQKVLEKIQEYNKKREESQPIKARTGGSTFKNPEFENSKGKKAWELIDDIGLRGNGVGDAKFSEKHCNFMVNSGKAKAEDLIELAKKAQEAVKKKNGINLEMEIKIIR
jgi:UDP-N-acetylmuramate dehydrogenase